MVGNLRPWPGIWSLGSNFSWLMLMPVAIKFQKLLIPDPGLGEPRMYFQENRGPARIADVLINSYSVCNWFPPILHQFNDKYLWPTFNINASKGLGSEKLHTCPTRGATTTILHVHPKSQLRNISLGNPSRAPDLTELYGKMKHPVHGK